MKIIKIQGDWFTGFKWREVGGGNETEVGRSLFHARVLEDDHLPLALRDLRKLGLIGEVFDVTPTKDDRIR
jgi:hypothetical protein